jgi:hypothetical protein
VAAGSGSVLGRAEHQRPPARSQRLHEKIDRCVGGSDALVVGLHELKDPLDEWSASSRGRWPTFASQDGIDRV